MILDIKVKNRGADNPLPDDVGVLKGYGVTLVVLIVLVTFLESPSV